MRALWVFHFPVYGGPHNTAVGVRGPLADLGWETVAALTDEPGNAERRLTEGGLETVTMPLHRLRASWHPRDNLRTAAAFRREVRALEQLIRARSCDLVVVTGLMNPHGAIAARRAGVPVVWQVLDTRTPPVPRSAAMTLVRRWADSVMFTGTAVEELHVGGRPLKSPSFQFSGGVDLQRFRPDPELRTETRRRFGVPEDALFVGTVANLNPMKGIEYFIRTASRVFKENPDSWFLINGSTYETHRAYTAALHREAEASGVPSERFIWTDGLPQNHYPALDVTPDHLAPALGGDQHDGARVARLRGSRRCHRRRIRSRGGEERGNRRGRSARLAGGPGARDPPAGGRFGPEAPSRRGGPTTRSPNTTPSRQPRRCAIGPFGRPWRGRARSAPESSPSGRRAEGLHGELVAETADRRIGHPPSAARERAHARARNESGWRTRLVPVEHRVALSPGYLEARPPQDVLDLGHRHPRHPVARLLTLDRQPQPHGHPRGIRPRRLIHRDRTACDPRHLAQPHHGVLQVVKPVVDEDEVEAAVREGQALHIGHQRESRRR